MATRSPPPRPALPERPPVAEVLDVDREYRERAATDDLRRIAPVANNPTGDAWLPVLKTTRGERRYSALFSNTETAHALKTTDDWVVVYLDKPDDGGQWTVVTEDRGELAGRRVVRGREAECRAHYEGER
jgi:DNA polymerase (family 10)